MIDWLNSHFLPGPLFGWWCLISAALIPVVWIRAGLRRRPAIRFSSTRLVGMLPKTWAHRGRFLLPLLRSAAIVALIVALARPQSAGSYEDLKEGIAIQMVLDVSGSMREDDFVLDGRRARRLDAVKKVFNDFVLGGDGAAGRDNDLIGMTTFAMYADTPCPLTLDHGSLSDLLAQTDIPGWVDGQQIREDPEAGFTALGDAIIRATDDLRRAGEQAIEGVPGAEAARSRVMILLTDGADNPPKTQGTPPPDPLDAARVAATLGIKVYTIGAVGSSPVRRSFFQQAPQVNEPMLREIAGLTGGTYFRATDTNSLVTIYDEIDRLERRRTGERSFQDNTEGARLAMLVGLALLMLELTLTHTRFRTIP